MDTKWTLFEIFINFFQAWMFTTFVGKKLTERQDIRTVDALFAKCIAVALIGGFLSLYLWFDITLPDSVCWIAVFAYTAYAFSDKWYVKLVWTACYAGIVTCVASATVSLTMTVTGKTFWQLLEPSTERLLFILFSNMILLAVLYISSKVKARQGRLSWFIMGLYITVNIVMFVGMEMLFGISQDYGVDKQPLFIVLFCMLIALLGILIMFELLSYNAEKQADLEARLEVHRLSEAHNAEVRSMYAGLVQYRHDIKHQFEALTQMISCGNVEEGKRFLEKLEVAAFPLKYATGCVAVDALLTAKSARMAQAGIEFSFSPYPLHELPVDETDICSLIGNLLDNAIEAICRMPETAGGRKISLSFSRTRNMLYITCINPADTAHVVRRGDTFISSKRDGRPGIGIASIRSIVDKAQGYCSFDAGDGRMKAEIALPYMKI